MSDYAVIDATGGIVNRIVLDDPTLWSPPAGHSAVLDPVGVIYEIGGTYLNGVYTAPARAVSPLPPPPQVVLPQDLMAQFTVVDYTAIKTAIAGSDAMGLLWASMQAQKDPMIVTNARFLAGWNALVQVLGQPRMTAIATALGATVLVV